MRDINRIIVHCSATTVDVSAETIRKWHKKKGWRDIGYHYVIRADGTIETGRPIKEAGAHTRGHNKDSIGICLAGGYDGTTDDYTEEQWHSLEVLIGGLYKMCYGLEVRGHNDYTNSKTCPNFDVDYWWATGRVQEHQPRRVG